MKGSGRIIQWAQHRPVSHLLAAELATYSRKRLTQTVHETRGASPYIAWLRFIQLGLGLGCIKSKEYVNYFLQKAERYPLRLSAGDLLPSQQQ